MGFNAISFLGGLGQGGMDQYRRQQDLDRQARQDAIYATNADLQAQRLKGQVSDEDLARRQAQALRDSAAPAAVNENASTLDTGDGAKAYDLGTDSQDIATSDAVQARRMNQAGVDNGTAPVALDPNAPATTQDASLATPVVGSGYAVNGKVFADKAAGLKTATDYNDPYQVDLRYANTLRSQGRGVEAAQYLAQQHSLRTNALLNNFGEQLQKVGPKVAVEQMYAKYLDGYTARVDMNPNGIGGVVNKLDSDGKIVGQMPFADNADLYGQARMLADPAGTYANKMALRLEQAKEQGKPVTTGPGSISTRVNDQGKTEVLADNRMTGFAPIFAPDGVTIVGYKKESERLGVNGKVDHYDAKALLDAVEKFSDKAATLPPELGATTGVVDHNLRAVYSGLLTDAVKQKGQSIDDAVVTANNALANFKNRAQSMVDTAHATDKKSTLSLPQAYSTLYQQYNAANAAAAQRKAAQPASGASSVNPANGHVTISPGAQQQADVDAGIQMIRSEYGGDLAKAQADVAQLQGGVADAKGDAKSILQSHLARLQAGINAVSAGALGAVPVTPPAPVATIPVKPINAPIQQPPAAPALDTATLQRMAATENAEMGAGKRMKYSPEVDAYLKQQNAAKAAKDQAASEALRAKEAQRSISALRGVGGMSPIQYR